MCCSPWDHKESRTQLSNIKNNEILPFVTTQIDLKGNMLSVMSQTVLLSHFSRVRLCATPQTAAHQAPPSLGFSRQEHWSGLPFLLQCMKVKSESEVAQSCPTLSDPMDYSLPGSSVHGIFQARALEWVPWPSPNESDRYTQILCNLSYMWNLKKKENPTKA